MLKILVPVKKVVDYNVQVRPTFDNKSVDIANVKMGINPFDEIALEEAVRIKEKNPGTTVVSITVGRNSVQDVLRSSLAFGADRSILVETDLDLGPLQIAKVLCNIVESEEPNLVLMGKQAIDDDCNQTGQMLAALLGWAQGTFVSALEVAGDTAKIVREVDGGLEHLEIKMPAIVSVDLRLNEPRYASLPNIMKAKKKPLDSLNVDDLGVDIKPRLTVIKVEEPAAREAGIKVADVKELVEKLKNEAKVI